MKADYWYIRAIHEAGHALVAIEQGIAFSEIWMQKPAKASVEGTPEVSPACEDLGYVNRLASVITAGDVALSVAGIHRPAESCSDARQIQGCWRTKAVASSEIPLEEWRASRAQEAKAILDRCWPQVLKLAEFLHEKIISGGHSSVVRMTHADVLAFFGRNNASF